jgi:hypothetical protein
MEGTSTTVQYVHSTVRHNTERHGLSIVPILRPRRPGRLVPRFWPPFSPSPFRGPDLMSRSCAQSGHPPVHRDSSRGLPIGLGLVRGLTASPG